MPLVTSKDNTLHFLVRSREYAVAKYTKTDCSICTMLQPIYEALSDEDTYAQILFLTIDAEKNPVAKTFLAGRDTPLIVTYRLGVVYEFKTAHSKENIMEILDALLEAPNIRI